VRGPVALVVLALAAACGGTPRPATVSPATREAVAAADDAERAREHDRARALYETALRDARDPPSQAFAARAYADVLLLWGEGEAAVVQLETVTTATPDDPSAWHDLGIVRHTLGDVPGARTALERAAALAPDDPRPHIALAALLWKSGRRAEALAEYRVLLTLELPARVRDKVEWAIAELSKPE
jgi:Flp pilus assembly protein TadD